MKVIAHRGASSQAPENTIEAFELAYQIGCRNYECDVRLTKDNVPIIIHDSTLDRTTNGQGLVSNTFWSHIKGLDAGSWFSPSFKNKRVPSLYQLLEWHRQRGGTLVLEIKVTYGLDIIMDIIQPYKSLVIASFNVSTLSQMRCRFPKMFLTEKWNDSVIMIAKALDVFSISMDSNYFDESILRICHRNGFKLGVYTVNKKVIGVDFIFVDL
jgi:glycerophosphoryl diester phosphodiesterase